MKKRILIIAGLAALSTGIAAVALTGCGYKFEEYSYNRGGTSERDWRALEYPDTDIKMDGVVDESAYGEGHLSFTDVTGVNMKVYAHMGEEGVFFGFVSNDENVNYNPAHDVFHNTSVEIQVAPYGTSSLNANVVQLRLGADGTPDQWVGFRSDNGTYDYTKKYIPSMGAVHINGELNGEADGYSVELYLPYTSIGLSEKPESVVCAPSFNTMPDPLSEARATWTMMLGCDLSAPSSWYVVNGEGMQAHTAGFSADGNGTTVDQKSAGRQFYYFGHTPLESYYLKAKLNVTLESGPFFGDEQFPKFGLVNKSDRALQSFYIDAAQRSGTNFGTVHAEQTTASGTEWEWDTNASASLEGHWGNGYIKNYAGKWMETIYYGGNLYFVLDGTLVKTVHGFAPASEGAIPGFMGFNTRMKFTSIEFEKDAQKVETEAKKYLPKELTIDGDLSDWTDEAVNRENHYKEITDAENGNSMKVHAFRGQDGLYVSYEVHHKVFVPAKKWDDGWSANTNIEMYVNGTDSKNQYAVTSFGTGGYMDAVMNVRRLEDRTFSTVAEIFIPFASLERDGFDPDGLLKVGFAFKTAGNSEDDKLNGTDWWAFEGTPKTKQYTVRENGIGDEYTLTYEAGEGTGAQVTQKLFGGDTIRLGPQASYSKAGYRFVAWSDEEEGTLYLDGSDYTMPDRDATLTALWLQNGLTGTHHVTYAKGDGEVTGAVPEDTANYAPGDAVTLQGCELSREGYRFAGWTDGTYTYRAGAKAYVADEDITFTAVWVKVSALTYSLGDAEGDVPEGGEYADGEKVLITSDIPERSGYDFYGWSFDDVVYKAGDKFEMPGTNVELTAVWRKKITVDGNLADWVETGSKSLTAHSLTDQRGATWYGELRSDGLYLAAELYHNNVPVTDKPEWFNNFNFELRIKVNESNASHFYVWLSGGTSAANVRYGADGSPNLTGVNVKFTYADGGSRASHHSIFEVFLPTSYFSGYLEADGSLSVGVAVKSGDYNNGSAEKFTGGSVNYESGDTWYAPYGVWPDNPDYYAYVTEYGMQLKEEHEHPDWKFGAESAVDDDGSIEVDGNISDWTGIKTLSIVGSGLYSGKQVTFYGKMTKAGLYLAAEAYHATFTTGAGNWFDNTNFELRIGRNFGSTGDDNRRPAQFWVNATGETTCAKSSNITTAAISHETVSDRGQYVGHHTVIECFISAADLMKYDYMVADGMIYVGMAWKTNGDGINNAQMGDGDAWWMPKGEHVNTLPACVDGTGVYTAKEYAERA